VGVFSPFRTELKAQMDGLWHAFKGVVDDQLEAEVRPKVQAMTDRLCETLVGNFCIGKKRAKPDIRGLLTSLDEKHLWLLGAGAEIARWMRHYLAHNVDLSAVMIEVGGGMPP